MKWFIYTLGGMFLFFSCSSDDEGISPISVNIEEGILGTWHVVWECNNRTHIWEFYDDMTFKIQFMNDTNRGTYKLSDDNLVMRVNFKSGKKGLDEYKIIILNEGRLKLDNTIAWSIDYDFVRACN
ncbi:hypothetical protein SAMN04487906_1505 [Zhouia amylolytica]|uniref:Lipocalin-like domain-containing protein n=2 Tax=Zhouia amylolytica TaxID=376730 RepID=W2UL88_9FLAO|nr:hypothetical protein [Zhouia amylolytica]ETN94753.1 hypothetical protein P278_26960 [Zhouia amylolytica AD3]MCQ0110935.1 hypothetical protein [Zhouia amylolytica]SFS74106.1 hypothetical protein SAMN04487906_1505 [Zhouia amylolytica]